MNVLDKAVLIFNLLMIKSVPIIRFIDKNLFKSYIKKNYLFFLNSRSLRIPFTHRFIIGYKSMPSILHELFYLYGSDKGAPTDTDHPETHWPAHTYADLYLMLFHSNRLAVKKVFECGLGTNNVNIPSNMGEFGKPGASHRAWKEYFPNAQIYGGDIDRQVLFNENRINTTFVDQTKSKSIRKMWDYFNKINFDIIIDDGLHTFEGGTKLFQNSFSRLRIGGVYIIEDVRQKDKLRFLEYFTQTDHRFMFVDLIRPKYQLLDNSVIII